MDSPLLILDTVCDKRTPVAFRRASAPYLVASTDPPPRDGLDQLRISGSRQFSEDELPILAGQLPPGAVVVDLRQESHGFLNGLAVSWHATRNFANEGKTLAGIEADENARLDELEQAGVVTVYKVFSKDANGDILEKRGLVMEVEVVATEKLLVRTEGLSYVRLPVRDHSRPDDEATDAFLELWKRTMPSGWLHFHCHAGEGRTGTLMAMADMLANARDVSFEDIARRQRMLGGLDLLHPIRGWKHPIAMERLDFLRLFHAYAVDNPGGSPLSWSAWLAELRSA